MARFTDDTKMFRTVKSREGCELLLKDLSRLYKWASMWQMKFKVSAK